MTESEPLVSLQSVTKTFCRKRGLLRLFSAQPENREVPVLQGIDFSAEPGSVTAILGANGSGKTTLLKMIMGLILPDSGRREVSGSLYFVPAQDTSFYERLTGRENLYFFGMLKGYSFPETREKIIRTGELLELDFLDARMQEFSTGMKQKLSLARALMMAPEILLLDEPWRSLDPEAAGFFKRKIRSLMDINVIRTVIYTSPGVPESESQARVLYLKRGRLSAGGSSL